MLTETEEMHIKESLAVLEREIDSYGVNLGSDSLRHYLRLKLAVAPAEQFGVILINGSNKVIAVDTLFYGGVDGVVVNLRSLAAHILSSAATQFIIYHNHPNMAHPASRQDVELTRRVSNTLKPFGVQCLDHFIVTGQIYSMAEDPLYAHLFQSQDMTDQNSIASSTDQEIAL